MSEKYRNFDHSRKKAIKEHCFECSGLNVGERKRCTAKGCALWAFRNGYEVDENDERIINPNHVNRPEELIRNISSENASSDIDCEPESDSDDEDEW